MEFSRLESDGYIVIPNFLSSEELERFKDDYINSTSQFGHYGIKMVAKAVMETMSNKFMNILSDIRQSTSIKADTIIYPQLYINNQKTSFDWHQEHESWYLEQESINHLNFYIPLHKELPNKSGISVIPMHVFKDQKELIHNKGARRFIASDVTRVIDDDLGNDFTINFDISKYSVTPFIMPGDLLLMRGDLIHKTQDTETERYSVSIRCTYGDKTISKSRLFSGCDAKLQYLENNSKIYNKIKSTFGDGDETTVSKVLSELLYEVE